MKIDPEFKALIPPLSADELAGLEANLLANGCRDALVVWAGHDTLLDGHHRHSICERYGLPYEITEVDLPDRNAAMDWIDSNQLGRRNLSPSVMSLLRGRIYNRIKKAAHGNSGGKNQYTELEDQNDTQASTADTLAEKYGVSAPTIKRDGQFAVAVEELKPAIPDIEQRVMSADAPTKQAVIQAAAEPERAEEILRPHVANNSGQNEWYTPLRFIESARFVMGGIDCDPASADIAQETVQAETYYTIESDGLKNKWHGNVWMNPPYSQPLIMEFSNSVVSKYKSEEIDQAIILVNNATETTWFQCLARCAASICFPASRIKFVDPQGNPSGAPLQGQAFLYFGKNGKAFQSEFKKYGIILMNDEI